MTENKTDSGLEGTSPSDPPAPGDGVVVSTNDGHLFKGRLIEVRTDVSDRVVAVIRLETGWVVSYPLEMVSQDKN